MEMIRCDRVERGKDGVRMVSRIIRIVFSWKMVSSYRPHQL